jgi:cell division septation protein DedD
MVAAVLIFGLFGAVLWYAYVDLAGLGASGPPPLVRAEAGPIKRDPDDPGGMDVTNRDAPSARILEEQAEPVRRERILPRADLAPPQPEPAPSAGEMAAGPPQPAPDAPAAPVPPNTTRPMESAEELPPALAAPEPPAGPTVIAAIEPEVAIEPLAAGDPPIEPLDPGVTPEGQTVVPAPAPRAATEAPPVLPQQGSQAARSTTVPQPAEATAPVRSAPAASPIFRVQLGAFRSDVAANQAWIDLQRRNRPALGELRASVLAAETSSGTFYRLQAGPLTSRDAAAQACAQVKQAGSDCFVVGPLP